MTSVTFVFDKRISEEGAKNLADAILDDMKLKPVADKILINNKKYYEPEDNLNEKNPAHYCPCGTYIRFRGFCSKKCHDKYYDMFKL